MAKVLLVEDDNNLRDIYQARLAAEGYEISTAQDGEEALVVAKQAKPDLVVSDVMMPKISGFEMLDILRNTPGLEHVKVIMLTALGQSEDRDRADSLGADKYLVKSQVTLEDIVKTAHELLGTSEPATAEAETAAAAPPAVAPAPTTDSSSLVTPPADIPEPEPVMAPPAEPVATAPTTNDATDDTSSSAASTIVDDGVNPAADQTTPTTSPTTEPADETVASASPASTSEPASNGSVAQEEALVQEQINNFVQTASDTTESSTNDQPATTEQAPSVPAPDDSAVPPTPEPVSQEARDTASDDKLMAEAVNELASQVPSDETTPPQAEASTPQTISAPVADEAPKENEQADNTNISLTGKKVIQPLDSKPKPDIHELLAREEAASGTSTPTPSTAPTASTDTPGVPPVTQQPNSPSFLTQPPSEQAASSAAVDEQPSGAPAPAPGEQKKKNDGGIDPNSIAL